MVVLYPQSASALLVLQADEATARANHPPIGPKASATGRIRTLHAGFGGEATATVCPLLDGEVPGRPSCPWRRRVQGVRIDEPQPTSQRPDNTISCARSRSGVAWVWPERISWTPMAELSKKRYAATVSAQP